MARRTKLKAFAITLATLLGLPVLFVACGEHSHDDASVPTTGSCFDPTLLSLPACVAGPDRFSDEACVVFDDRISNNQITRDDAHAPTIRTPTEGQALPAATPFAFSWDAPMAFVPVRALPRAMTFSDELSRWTTLVPAAEAHCAPFSGRAYELSFKVGSRVILRREQSETTWTPDPTTWSRIVAGAGTSTVDLTIYAATFSSSQIPSGGGPYVGTTVRHFTITP